MLDLRRMAPFLGALLLDLRRMAPFLGALLLMAIVATFCDAGPFGIFGRRAGCDNCSTGQCANGQCDLACPNGQCNAPVAATAKPKPVVSVLVSKSPAPVEKLDLPANPEAATATPLKPPAVHAPVEQTEVALGPVRNAAGAAASAVGRGTVAIVKAPAKVAKAVHQRERFRPIRNWRANRGH